MPLATPSKLPRVPLLIAIVCGFSQVLWFSLTCYHGIDYDGMAYLGIARHLRNGQWHEAINGFRSPLLPWLIAAATWGDVKPIYVGKIINAGTFLLSTLLLYLLTWRLWRSEIAASVSALLFVLARGYAAIAIEMITPDFLFAALALCYFVILLRCLRGGRLADWVLLGLIHGLAFLAKAFALPWLALCSLLAAGFSAGGARTKLARLGTSACIPILFAAGWASILHLKYGVYTTGTQFKSNLFQWTLRVHTNSGAYSLLRDTRDEVDEYFVDDPMPPDSPLWRYTIRVGETFPKVLQAETRNIPHALKETAIVITPGGLLAFAISVVFLSARKREYPIEWRFAVIVFVAAISLLVTYSMLVFDSRYLFPLTPLLLALAAPFFTRGASFPNYPWRLLCIALAVWGAMYSLVYSSSPFRLLVRDFQTSCYAAGNILRTHPRSAVVSIGSGPFPEHGVGWEAGYKGSFFGDARIAGALDFLPASSEMEVLMDDISKASPDAILWGRPSSPRYVAVLDALSARYPGSSRTRIGDVALGECGMVLTLRSQN